MEFTILERITLQELLPKQEDYVTMKIIRDLRMELSFSEKEIKDFEINQTNSHITWNTVKEKKKKIDIGETAHSIICEALKKADKEKKINEQNISLYEKFILTIKQ